MGNFASPVASSGEAYPWLTENLLKTRGMLLRLAAHKEHYVQSED
ncbi:hypothetical protein RIEGSTA812A_PEG_809 [invertebrate metagenome]|uniref:Uncharacterized protein n=1 Tax=invertebrate metagenome TaxID=1711999 RepID=A0A484H5L8_9ZZZZ